MGTLPDSSPQKGTGSEPNPFATVKNARLRGVGPLLRRTAHPIRRILAPLFIVCLVMLGGAALGLRPAMARLAARLEKLPIAPRQSVKDFDVTRMPSFRRLTKGIAMPNLEESGTAEVACVPLEDLTPGAEKRLAGILVTYYADPHTKVPHTPDVCYRQIGAVVHGVRAVRLDLPGGVGADKGISAQAMRIDRADCNLLLVYVFCANGRFCTDRQEVRMLLNWPGERYTYFSKIEAFTQCNSDADEPRAMETCQRLLREALPLLMSEYFPDSAALSGP